MQLNWRNLIKIKKESDNPNHSSFRIPLLHSCSDGVLRKILEGHLTQWCNYMLYPWKIQYEEKNESWKEWILRTFMWKKIASAELCLAKPAVHRLCAEVPCNYIPGRLAAALQSIFASPNSARAIFFRCIHVYFNSFWGSFFFHSIYYLGI